MKKTLAAIYVSFALLFGTLGLAALVPTKGVVTAKIGLNVRERPATSSKILTALPMNAELTILSVEGNWYKITNGFVTGYVYSTYVSVTDSREINESDMTKEEIEKMGQDLHKSAINANITETP